MQTRSKVFDKLGLSIRPSNYPGQSPVEWGDFPYIRTSAGPYVRTYVLPPLEGPRASRVGLRPSQSGLKASQAGLRASQLSLRASQPGLRGSEACLAGSES